MTQRKVLYLEVFAFIRVFEVLIRNVSTGNKAEQAGIWLFLSTYQWKHESLPN